MIVSEKLRPLLADCGLSSEMHGQDISVQEEFICFLSVLKW